MRKRRPGLTGTASGGGNPIGVTNIYLIPQGRQLEDPNDPDAWIPATPNESGIAINPETGTEYVVGDSVEKFAVLSKGVEISDYLSDPDVIEVFVEQGDLSALINQYHTFYLRINADVTTPSDISLITEFIRRAKPAHARLLAGMVKVIEDVIEIEDVLIFGRALDGYDAISLGLPRALKYDSGSMDTALFTVGGTMYARYLTGNDLATTQGSLQVSSADGGFINTRSGQSHDSPYLRAGDRFRILDGHFLDFLL